MDEIYEFLEDKGPIERIVGFIWFGFLMIYGFVSLTLDILTVPPSPPQPKTIAGTTKEVSENKAAMFEIKEEQPELNGTLTVTGTTYPIWYECKEKVLHIYTKCGDIAINNDGEVILPENLAINDASLEFWSVVQKLVRNDAVEREVKIRKIKELVDGL